MNKEIFNKYLEAREWQCCEEDYTPTDDDYESIGKLICCRCYDIVDELFSANCEERSELLKDTAIGMYHCPDCGAMLLAGYPHPPLCKQCIERKHPQFDRRVDE